MNRRVFLQSSAALIAGIALAPAGHLAAGDDWCWDDPSLTIMGHSIAFLVLLPQNQRAYVQDVALTVNLPSGVPAQAYQPRTSAYHMTYTVGVLQLSRDDDGSAQADWKLGEPVQIEVELVVRADIPVPFQFQAGTGISAGSFASVTGLSDCPLRATFTVPGFV